MPSKIEWCDETINPVVGCSKISEGCDNCYAARFVKRGMCPAHKSVHKWNGLLEWQPDQLEKISRWKKPRRIFVGSMTDLFHESMTYNWLCEIMDWVVNNEQHTFIFLTKRPEGMKEWLRAWCDKYHCQIPENLWLGVSAENQARADERIPILLDIPAKVLFVSCEPLLGPISLDGYQEKGITGSFYNSSGVKNSRRRGNLSDSL